MSNSAGNWEALARKKKDSINDLIPKEWRLTSSIPSAEEQRDVTGNYLWQYLSDREIEITETDAVDIVKQTSTGKWKAEEVVTAFCHRASLAHQILNCLHEIFFDAAIREARKLDEYFVRHNRPIGPLHGLPVSLKDQFHVKGVETTIGYVGWINTFQGKKGTGLEKNFESEMVHELRNVGALLYCKTSVPHTLMSGETVNNIIGYTWNPKNRYLSSGGSSGGEGALIGLKGSPIGLGTDIGGSIRIPAAFNGLYGLRPSSGRLPYEGMANTMDGQNSVLSVVGPLSHSAASLRLMVKSLLTQQPWLHDPLVLEIPWRDDQEREVFSRIDSTPKEGARLAFGILRHDGNVTPNPPIKRALGIVEKTLEALGHRVIEWKPPSHKRGAEITTSTWFYDGGADIHADFALSGEPVSYQISRSYGIKAEGEKTASHIAATNIAKREYQKEYMEYWNGTKELTGTGQPVDAFIMPLAPFPAARPESYGYYGYSTVVNCLDYSNCVIPVTTVDKSIDTVEADFEPLSELDREQAAYYDPEIFDGAHVSVQLVGRRLQEEKVLALAEHVGSAVKATR